MTPQVGAAATPPDQLNNEQPATKSTHGWVAPGFERVAEAFEQNFTTREEVGAAFAATLDGRPVVDLWGGVADSSTGRPWRMDTVQLIFSGTKGLTALCIAILLDRGRLALEQPVSAYWPEFAAEGKEAITVSEIVSHRGRLPGMRTPLSEDDLLDPPRMAALLAAQAPETDPRAAFLYHSLTYGWLCDQLIRRVDGRSVGRFLAEEVVEPLGLELWIGLPEGLEQRVAVLQYAHDWGQTAWFQADPFPGDDLWASILLNPPFMLKEPMLWNLPAWHAAEIAAGNAIGTARSIARLYGALACGGAIDGVRLLSAETLALACTPLVSGTHPFIGEPMSFGVGFALQTADGKFGPADIAFGHGGGGGSIHGAWTHERVGFSYAMNELRDDPAGDGRPQALLDALHTCVVGK
ncbi:MAG TPA: serine hydrolase domain-containing protein [Solirubrobacteraceae bacterium]|nr:serine hydrolase domain-containing protein [Solirubrobacteraceae bacterium]